MLKNIKAVIFDLDGTLYDYKKFTGKILKELCFKSKLLAAKERKARSNLKGCSYNSREEFQEAFYKEFSLLTKKTPEFLKDWYNNTYIPAMIRALSKNYTARKEAASLFKYLRTNKIKTAVFSDYGFVEERLTAIGLDTTLPDFIFSAEDFGGLKPSKEVFEKAAQKLEVSADKILMVGDRYDTDGEGAKSSGMKFIQIKTHKTKKEEDALSWEDFIVPFFFN